MDFLGEGPKCKKERKTGKMRGSLPSFLVDELDFDMDGASKL